MIESFLPHIDTSYPDVAPYEHENAVPELINQSISVKVALGLKNANTTTSTSE
jgi:hypothetical protein